MIYKLTYRFQTSEFLKNMKLLHCKDKSNHKLSCITRTDIYKQTSRYVETHINIWTNDRDTNIFKQTNPQSP